jgi:hypothetical protein
VKREWKPGDVVTATVKGRENVRLVAGWSKYAPQLRWCEMSPRWGDGDDEECWFMPNAVTEARPLVVIDPEDREQVDGLWAILRDGLALRSRDNMQAALREFANPTPPRPDEPTGLFAQVEDSDGTTWYRSAEQNSVWRKVYVNTDSKRYVGCDSAPRAYAEIDVVRVLSDGIA